MMTLNKFKKLKRVVIKEELLALTGDINKAIILNQFIYWSERIKDVDKFIEEETKRLNTEGIDSTIEKQHGWIYKTAEELSEETMLGLSPSGMRRHIKVLVDNGWLEERKNPKYKWDKTTQYRTNILKIQKDLYLLGYSLEGYPLQINPEILKKLCNTDEYRISILENGDSKIENYNTQNRKAIPEITTKIKNKIRYINADGNDLHLKSIEDNLIDEDQFLDNKQEVPLEENSTSLDLEKEALKFLNLMPNKTGWSNFSLEYSKVRLKYSKEELERVVCRYKKDKERKNENKYHNCDNFFRNNIFIPYLDSNWEQTKKYTDEQIQKYSKNKHTSNEPEQSDEWSNAVDDVFK